MIVKFGGWSYDEYHKSNHPEIFAIRNIILKNPLHEFVLVGLTEGAKYKCFREKNMFFYNLPSKNKIKSMLSQLLLFSLACTSRPSIIIGFGLSNIIPLSLASILTHSELISVVTGELWHSGSSIPKFFYSFLLKITFQKSNAILAISESVRKEIVNNCRINPIKISIYKYKVHPMFNPFVPKDIKTQLNPAGPIVLVIARISPVKGLHYLVEASRIVVKQVPNVKFIIKGYPSDQKYREYLLALIKEYKLQEYITMEEWSPYSEVPKYMAAADVLVLPSVSEALGMVILEASTCGVPVIATRVGGIPDVLVHGVNGLLVEPADIRGLADAIINVLTNENLRKGLSHGSLSTVQNSKRKEFETVLNKLIFAPKQ
jgi:glycosyltransferase involved in cell wall biosynthesis